MGESKCGARRGDVDNRKEKWRLTAHVQKQCTIPPVGPPAGNEAAGIGQGGGEAAAVPPNVKVGGRPAGDGAFTTAPTGQSQLFFPPQPGRGLGGGKNNREGKTTGLSVDKLTRG